MDAKKKTHYKGLLGELEFTLHLIKNGWHIFRPLDQNSRVDLIIEKDGKFKRIQVKYCTPYRGCLRVDLEHPGRNTEMYSSNDIDAVGVFDPENQKFYLIPLSDILPKKEIWIRIKTTNNKQRKNINWGDEYLI